MGEDDGIEISARCIWKQPSTARQMSPPGGVEGWGLWMCDGGLVLGQTREGGDEWVGRNKRALFRQRTKRTARFARPNESGKMADLPAVRLARSV